MTAVIVKNCKEGNGLLAMKSHLDSFSIFFFEDLTAVPCYKGKYSRDIRKAHVDLKFIKIYF